MSPLNHFNKKHNDKEATTMAQRILGFCVAVLLGVILLYLAVGLLAQFWGWLVLLAVVILAGFVAVRIYRWRRDRW